MFRINHNMTAMNARRHLGAADIDTRRSTERLSSGLRINRAADDAAGLFVSEQMRAKIKGLEQANRNVQSAISLFQTAEGGMEQIASMLIRLKELAIASADGTFTDVSRGGVQLEVAALLEEIDRISTTTTFNGQSLLEGTVFTFQVGDEGSADNRINITIGPVTTGVILEGVSSVDFANQVSAIQVITSIELGVVSLASVRTQVGAAQNRLERTVSNIQVQLENTQNAESVIRDADFASEVASLTRALILVQSGTSVLQQANLLPQNALSLLQF
ncbi:flagellin FliC [Candidatus Poribacteria bacterium]|jgi:flagellin|nr:flagellin FliC [Candidatus Poribacteria bacterium]MBT5536503.1 flagellin FliC [Candidatus Poribacteria bacterium]MBT7098695.1 flagellin FliC [Candidatus Poribacteria bacterium]MBT7804851.1 flagellin FliC [Candidatus Poribacteria bacterium]